VWFQINVLLCMARFGFVTVLRPLAALSSTNQRMHGSAPAARCYHPPPHWKAELKLPRGGIEGQGGRKEGE
jgi:hypothetical protein